MIQYKFGSGTGLFTDLSSAGYGLRPGLDSMSRDLNVGMCTLGLDNLNNTHDVAYTNIGIYKLHRIYRIYIMLLYIHPHITHSIYKYPEWTRLVQ